MSETSKSISSSQKIWVGVSGGVDSSVALYLLKQAGFDVTAVFIRSWQPEGYPCTLTSDRQDALRVAAYLNVPFITLDLSEVYKNNVVDVFIKEYQEGRTPNPDILCNQSVKFGAFLAEARKHGAHIATGHYARTNHSQLLTAKDTNKDQTYFLYRLTKSILHDVHFPLHNLTKPEVRAIAKAAGLPTALKEESQGLCFVGEIPMKEFLKPYLPHEKGVVQRSDGSTVGTHDGTYFYTIGERIPAEGGKAYVHRIDHTRNVLVVESDPPLLAKGDTFTLADISWIGDAPTQGTYQARFRHRGELVPVSLSPTEGTLSILGGSTQPPAFGQSAVIYHDDVCLGGGIVSGHA